MSSQIIILEGCSQLMDKFKFDKILLHKLSKLTHVIRMILFCFIQSNNLVSLFDEYCEVCAIRRYSMKHRHYCLLLLLFTLLIDWFILFSEFTKNRPFQDK